MISYPAIPLPQTQFAGDVIAPVIRTDVTNGLVEQDSRYAAKLKTYSATWDLTEDEFVTFEEWFSETLVGGVLTFGMFGVSTTAVELQPFRFVGGVYQGSKRAGLGYAVSATIESLLPGNAPANRVPPVAPWLRLVIDPIGDQLLTLSHRNAQIATRPTDGNTRTLRIFPPTDPTQYIYFGIQNFGEGDTLITSLDVDPIPLDPVYPFPDLPQVQAGFVDAGERRVARLNMDSGHPRQWVEWDTTRKNYTATWIFTLDQLLTFQAFFFVTLKSGTLKFTMELPVDGQFIEVPVRFIGGTYKEAYDAGDFWLVSAQLEREVDQTVFPSVNQPYGRYYSPTVNVTVNRRIFLVDTDKFFIVNPAEGQTISLHIGTHETEFGLMVIGLGNVLITRGPFIRDIGSLEDSGHTSYLKPAFELHNSLRDLGVVTTDYAATSFLNPALELLDVLEELGALGTDYAVAAYGTPAFELLVVLEELGTIGTDYAATAYQNPIFELVIP